MFPILRNFQNFSHLFMPWLYQLWMLFQTSKIFFHFPIEFIISNTLLLFPIQTSLFSIFTNPLFKPPFYSFLYTPLSYFLILPSKLSSITSSFSSHPFKFQVFFFLLFKFENCDQHHGKSNKKEVYYKEEHKEKRRKLYKFEFRRREIGKIIPFYHSI